MTNHYILPDIPTGYTLNPDHGFFSVIVPEATTNLVINPSVENNVTSYNGYNGSIISRSVFQQRRGAAGLRVRPTANVESGVWIELAADISANTSYTFSADILATAGIPFVIIIECTINNAEAKKEFYSTGFWQRVWVTLPGQVLADTPNLIIRKNNSTNTKIFYTDGWQLEAKAYPTTYCDGDQQGLVINQVPPAYQWTGTPHASTSTRSAQTRAGGRVVNFDAYDFIIQAYAGLGMPTLNNVSNSFGLQDGAIYQRTIAQPRTFAINGRFKTTSLRQLYRQRAALISALAPNAVAVQQPLILRYQAYRCNDPIGDVFDIVCNYGSGLEQNTDNVYQENAAIQFTAFLPSIVRDGENGAATEELVEITDANYILQRSPEGVWQSLSTGTNNIVRALTVVLSGLLYLGGDFTTVGTVVNAEAVASWDGSTWAILDSGPPHGADDVVRALTVAPSGLLYLGGDFTAVDSLFANRVASFNGTSFSNLSTGMNGPVHALVVGSDGSLFAGGVFSVAGGGLAFNVARWDGAAWSPLSSGISGDVYALAIGPDGSLYIGGSFATTGGGLTVNRIVKWDGSSFSALSTGLNGTVRTLVFGPDGSLYIGGSFTATVSGLTANRIIKWNGSSFSALGTGANGDVYALAIGPDGSLYAGGSFSTMNGIALPQGLARWDGSNWYQLDVALPGSPTVQAICVTADNQLTIGFNTSGTATAASVTTIISQASANVYPRFRISGPTTGTSRIFQLINYTTGDAIYFNYTINAGETAMLDLSPGNITFTSSLQGNILGKIMPGSKLATWHLQPGNNNISFLTEDTSVQVLLSWKDRFWSLDSVFDVTEAFETL